MKRRKTSMDVNELFEIPGRRQKKEWEKVQDDNDKPVRGLWQRKGVFYAQLHPSGKTQQYKYRLEHPQTVPQAITAMQVLKDSRKKGTLLPARWGETSIQSCGCSDFVFIHKLKIPNLKCQNGALTRRRYNFSSLYGQGAVVLTW